MPLDMSNNITFKSIYNRVKVYNNAIILRIIIYTFDTKKLE
jgi:hypothetical protein